MRGFDRFLPKKDSQPDTPASESEPAKEPSQQQLEGDPSQQQQQPTDLQAQIAELREAHARTSANLDKLVELQTQSFQRQQQPAQPQQQPAVEPPKIVSEDDFETAIRGIVNEDGELDQAGIKKLAATMGQAVRANAEALIQQHVDPLRSVGTSTLEAHTREILALKGAMPYYGPKGDPDITKQVDSYLQQLDPGVRANGEVIQRVYNAVVGDPQNLSRIINAEVEKVVRQQTEEIETPKPGGRSVARATTGKDESTDWEAPTPEELGGTLGLQALNMLGRGGKTHDELAKSLGYSDWDDYMKQARATGYFGGEAQ